MFLSGRLLPFIGKAIVFLIALSVVWYFIAPAYNSLLAVSVERLIPAPAALTVQQGTIYIHPQGDAESVGGIYASALHYGLLLVVALIAATPGLKLVRRLKFFGIAVITLYIIHVVTIVPFARAALSSQTPSTSQDPLLILLAVIGSDLFPVLIWALVSYKYFRDKPKGSPVTARQSGLKSKRQRREPSTGSHGN